ncbi:MAG: FCD domain-containing protein [Sphaerochaeta sp.]|jgi:DNA-binding GntR family transcriptional regulator|uniref:FCD domain-containing protein n=1 Tax=Sphaerochaeta sp. TaxID=1972642 RepID=UPI002A36EB95|nr:FCD domain-containing protein [Sphaerochaeta sp.]MDX9824851.1 FCD domain-containing protein [Sphaerochaeta sp.]
MDKPDEVMRFSDLHFQFHLEMVRASDNAILLTTFSRLNLNTNSLLFYQRLSNQGKIQTQDEHRKILAYLEARDTAKGEKFMFAHLWRKRKECSFLEGSLKLKRLSCNIGKLEYAE